MGRKKFCQALIQFNVLVATESTNWYFVNISKETLCLDNFLEPFLADLWEYSLLLLQYLNVVCELHVY